jgi:Dynamin family
MDSSLSTGEVDGSARLLRLAMCGNELGARDVSNEACALASRVSQGRFYVACIGQFKRGKSTLINAIVGEPILPVGFTPVTAVPTVIRFGEQRRAQVQGRDGSWREVALSELGQYVSEEGNPENEKKVNGVEVFFPSPLLSAGLCLVDTPGLGSVFTGNSAATRAFIPHVDAAMLVVGADPPLSQEELALAEAAARHVRNFILVLNKADRTSEEERSAAVAFTQRLLEEKLKHAVGPVYEISASERLENKGPERDWGKLAEALEVLVRDSGAELIRAACERGLERLSEQLLAIIAFEREALERPLEDSERQIAKLKETLSAGERLLGELSFLFMAEQRRLSDLLAGRHETFLTQALPKANVEFEKDLALIPRSAGPAYRRAAMSAAQEIARRRMLPWLRTEQEEAEKEYRVVTRRFVEEGNEFLRKLADSAVPELARMPHALDDEKGFRVQSKFSFLELIEIAQPASPLRWLADLVLGIAGGRSVIEASAREFLTRLMESNCTRVQSDTLRRVEESRGRLEAEVRKLLHEVNRASEQALAHARKAQAEGAAAVQSAFSRLDNVEGEIRGLRPSVPGANGPQKCSV